MSAPATVYTLYDTRGNSQDVTVCARHAESMPLVDRDRVTARPADCDVNCEFCGARA